MSTPPIAKASPDWSRLRAWNEGKIQQWREELEVLTVSADKAQQLRGMISALREQIDVVDNPITHNASEEPQYG